MAEKIRSTKNPGGGSSPGGFWVTAQAWWERATRDSASVKRNLAMLGGVTLAAILCIWSLGGVLAIIVGSVHLWSMAGVGAGVASVLAALGIRRHRRRRDR